MLDNGIPGVKSRRLGHGIAVEIRSWNEAIVSRNMCGGLCCAHGQLVMLIADRLRLGGELGAWVVTMRTH